MKILSGILFIKVRVFTYFVTRLSADHHLETETRALLSEHESFGHISTIGWAPAK